MFENSLTLIYLHFSVTMKHIFILLLNDKVRKTALKITATIAIGDKDGESRFIHPSLVTLF